MSLFSRHIQSILVELGVSIEMKCAVYRRRDGTFSDPMFGNQFHYRKPVGGGYGRTTH